jgi:hypothetical protein
MSAKKNDGAKPWRATLLGLGLVLVLATGITLRLTYPDDIEWKGDERWTFNQAQLMVAGGAWPDVGMPSSVRVPDPSLSLWVFAGLDWISGAKTPPQLARVVQSLNAAALLALVLFAFTAIPRERREPWLWAAALWAVNPLAIIFERKIWPPSVLPLASVALIAAWYYRRTPAAAFAWGLSGALMAQVHMAAGVFAAALALWTLLYERGLSSWKSWLAGSIVGTLPALPWLWVVLSHTQGAPAKIRFPILDFFLRWITQPFGFGIEYALSRRQMVDYLRGPLLAGHPTYLMAVTHLVLAVTALVIAVRAVQVVRAKGWPGARPLFLGYSAETLLINATLWGYGGILTLLTVFVGVDSHRHYMIFVAPILALWAALAAMYGDQVAGRAYARTILIVLCLGQAILSAGLLSYIDRVAVIHGQYGPTWRAQQPGFSAANQ